MTLFKRNEKCISLFSILRKSEDRDPFLPTFPPLVETGSLTHAGRALNVPLSAIAQRIKALEAEFAPLEVIAVAFARSAGGR